MKLKVPTLVSQPMFEVIDVDLTSLPSGKFCLSLTKMPRVAAVSVRMPVRLMRASSPEPATSPFRMFMYDWSM